MGAFVDACIALRLRKLQLAFCRVVPAVLPQLTRLVAAGTLRELLVLNDVAMFDVGHESTRLFAAAVRASVMTCISFFNSGVLPENVVEAAAFINLSINSIAGCSGGR